MTSLASDGDSVYGTGYDFGGGAEDDFEGTFRARWSDGSLVWLEDCHGDNYSVAVQLRRRLHGEPRPLLRQHRRLPADEPDVDVPPLDSRSRRSTTATC